MEMQTIKKYKQILKLEELTAKIYLCHKKEVSRRKWARSVFVAQLIFVIQKTAPKKPLALTGIQLQSRIKNTPKNEQKQELKISQAVRCMFGNFSIFAVNTNK